MGVAKNEVKAIKVAVLATTRGVSAALHGVSAAPRGVPAAPHGVLALQDTHRNSRGPEGPLHCGRRRHSQPTFNFTFYEN